MSKRSRRKKRQYRSTGNHTVDGKTISLADLSARYDASMASVHTSRYFSNADFLDADATNSSTVRATIRSRARYEFQNNCYAKGIVTTLASDTVGTGPRLNITGLDNALQQQIEHAFTQWATDIHLASKLLTMRTATIVDGEVFALLFNGTRSGEGIKLDIRLVESDQITSGLGKGFTVLVDGITFDENGYVTGYDMLKSHPGSRALDGKTDIITVPADSMVHQFHIDRPGTHRGVSELAPALALFSHLRRYRQSVILSAETAANFSAVIQSSGPVDADSGAIRPTAMEAVELEQNMFTVLPEGYTIGQLKAEQPTVGFDAFSNSIIGEIARCLNVPFNVAAGNSSSYNYASGRLDHQTYFKTLRIERKLIEEQVLTPILNAWLLEASLVGGILPKRRDELTIKDLKPQWFWDGTEHVDPNKEANAQKTRLNSNTTTLAAEYARQGKDWRIELVQRAAELRFAESIGLIRDPASTTKGT